MIVVQLLISIIDSIPLESEIITPDKHVFKPTTVTVVNKPLPAGIVAPASEKPITVEPPEETVKPASAAAPPEALTKVEPFTSN